MSLAKMQQTCAVCGAPLDGASEISIEVLIDPIVRYVVVCWDHSTFTRKATHVGDVED